MAAIALPPQTSLHNFEMNRTTVIFFRTRHAGFSLTELAIVMLIVSLLIGGMLMPMAAQQEIKQRQETDTALSAIREALIGYVLMHGYLPCPAPVDLSTAGVEGSRDATTGNCNHATNSRWGLVPWVTLGVGHYDGWNNLIRYSVTPAFSNSVTLFTLASTGDITIQTRDSSLTIQTLAQSVPVALLSHGKRAAWAYTGSGTQISDSANDNADEDANGNAASIGTTLISHNPTNENASITGGEFDDIVVWIPATTLFARLSAAGKL